MCGVLCNFNTDYVKLLSILYATSGIRCVKRVKRSDQCQQGNPGSVTATFVMEMDI